jgi:hypothetical protein
LKRVMWARFVPSYYARDLLHKLQQLRQGTKSVEKYYQELQMNLLLQDLWAVWIERFGTLLNTESIPT